MAAAASFVFYGTSEPGSVFVIVFFKHILFCSNRD